MSSPLSLHRACDRCRRKKAKCDSVDYSCTGCRGAGHACTFDIAPGKRGPKGKPRRRYIPSPQEHYHPFSLTLSPHLSPPALSLQPARHLTVPDRYDLLSKAVTNVSSLSNTLEGLLQQCTELFFSYIVPFNMSVHEPTLRHSLSQALSTNPRAFSMAQSEFTLLTAVCAKVCFFMPSELFPVGKSLAETFLEASRSCLADYSDTDLENPCADSITIRYLHSNCLHTNARPMISWHVFGEALRLVQRMRLHDENSYLSLDPIEAEMRRNAFWQIYSGDKSLAVLRSMPMTVTDYAFAEGITVALPSTEDNELSIGTNAGICLWRYAADLILRTRVIRKDRDLDVLLSPADHKSLSELYIRFATCLDDLPPHLLPEGITPSPSVTDSNPTNTRFAVQIADLHVTYHCLQMHLTQQLDEIGYFAQHGGESNDMVVLRKTEIAGDMVRLLQRIPFWSLQVNGEPCAEKIRLVGASLLALIQEPSSSPLISRARRDFDVLLDILSRLDSKASDALRRDVHDL
ncbi:hypothetical protein ASPCAL00484 [Aspergillus calidoustus]|uniref:Zn(2)-C6 fungal-type domain-containing protein n=1 Tax=Aspergillus calidoustus TaxID=454130 RepID=A0A0U5C153_ASPCI|nr:hypothetical protein ASPCAL00484 [Aspergillus calidoustus]